MAWKIRGLAAVSLERRKEISRLGVLARKPANPHYFKCGHPKSGDNVKVVKTKTRTFLACRICCRRATRAWYDKVNGKTTWGGKTLLDRVWGRPVQIHDES